MNRSLVADLGLGPEIWLFLTLLSTLTVFFKFTRFWSIRNLDLVLLFALAPGLMRLVGSGEEQPWEPFVWLFAGSACWLLRCLLDLGLTRRPLLEPNLNASALGCTALGLLGLLVAESILLPLDAGAARNPASTNATTQALGDPLPGAADSDDAVAKVLRDAPLPVSLKRNSPQVIVSRVLAGLSHLAIVLCLYFIGSRIFERPISGLAMGVCYLLSPYSRIAVVDSGQLIPAALLSAAVLGYRRPALAGLAIGLSGGWLPACMGLVPLWVGFYRGRGASRFLAVSLLVAAGSWAITWQWPALAEWATALGARSLGEAGLLGFNRLPSAGSFWTRIDPVYRLPVVIGYLALVVLVAFWPTEKNLGEVICLSAALLVASQFWYLDEGGTLILLYLPLVLMMMFRPNLASRRPPVPVPRARVPEPAASAA